MAGIQGYRRGIQVRLLAMNGDTVRARGRFLMKYIALMIEARMQNVISASRMKDLTGG